MRCIAMSWIKGIYCHRMAGYVCVCVCVCVCERERVRERERGGEGEIKSLCSYGCMN